MLLTLSSLTTSDLLYSGICEALSSLDYYECPDEGTSIAFDHFNFSYMGLITALLMGWTLFLPKMGKILDLVELGIYSIIGNSLFLTYIGIRALINGEVNFKL